MNLIMKIALIENQVKEKTKLVEHWDGYEIQCLGEEADDWSLVQKLQRPIKTIHLPIPHCGISRILANVSVYNNEVIDKAKQLSAGVVIHCDITLKEILGDSYYKDRLKKLANTGVVFHLENTGPVGEFELGEFGTRPETSLEAIAVCNYINSICNKTFFFPLLDTCHSLMWKSYPANREPNLKTVIKAYETPNFKVHLSNAIGSGLAVTGGIHGENFELDKVLLAGIIDVFSGLQNKPDLILEVNEEYNDNPTKTMWLNRTIKKLLEQE